MKFNVDKCCVMHCGRNNPEYEYKLYGTSLRKSEGEKDLGIIVNKDMKFSGQVSSAVKKANRTVGMIRRNFQYLNCTMFQTLYSTLVRPHLEYAVAVWSPFQLGHKAALENVQRRATKMIKELKGKTYEERLEVLDLMTTDYRRIRGDMILTFKILTDKLNIRKDILRLSDDRRTRGHEKKLVTLRSRTKFRSNFFTRRVTNAWNDLSQKVIGATCVDSFKRAYDQERQLKQRSGTTS